MGLHDSPEDALGAYLRGRPEVLLGYLFGSYCANRQGGLRDIDIGIYVHPEALEKLDRLAPYGYRASLITELAHLLHYRAVDLVLLNTAPSLLQREVIARGRLIVCRSEKDRIRFEVSTLKRYADTAFLRKTKRLYMKKRIEKGLTAYA